MENGGGYSHTKKEDNNNGDIDEDEGEKVHGEEIPPNSSCQQHYHHHQQQQQQQHEQRTSRWEHSLHDMREGGGQRPEKDELISASSADPKHFASWTTKLLECRANCVNINNI